MSKSEEFLDLVQNHHHKGYFFDQEKQNFCLLGAANKVYGVKVYGSFQDVWTHQEKMDETIRELFPTLQQSLPKNLVSITPHFNDKYASKEDIMLVAKHFANKIDTIKE